MFTQNDPFASYSKSKICWSINFGGLLKLKCIKGEEKIKRVVYFFCENHVKFNLSLFGTLKGIILAHGIRPVKSTIFITLYGQNACVISILN